MQDSKAIQEKLLKKFNFLGDSIKVIRERRISVEVNEEKFRDIFNYAAKDLGLSALITITGLDEGEKFGLIYHLGSKDGVILNIRTYMMKSNPVVNTITDIFPNAEIYEREISDLLGVKFEGLKPGIRYPLPDDWPKDQFPLRKDWKAAKKNA